ncbi:flagellar export protein FliJ [Lachnospiraceae bacterium ZAX-1]
MKKEIAWELTGMAKFNYKMQNILNVKYKLETQAKTAYAIAAAKRAEEEEILAQLNKRKAFYEQQAVALVSGRINIRDIKSCRVATETMKGFIRSQLMAVHLAERNLESARVHLNDVMIDRKTHEILREKAFEVFKKEIQDEENKAIDELVCFVHHAQVEMSAT